MSSPIRVAVGLLLRDNRLLMGERPAEKEAQADQAQAKFKDRRSDFVTLLRLWEGGREASNGGKSAGGLKKFRP